MIVWGVYRENGVLDGIWVTHESAQEFASSHPGWFVAILWYQPSGEKAEEGRPS